MGSLQILHSQKVEEFINAIYRLFFELLSSRALTAP